LLPSLSRRDDFGIGWGINKRKNKDFCPDNWEKNFINTVRNDNVALTKKVSKK
jgi:hypothetical protein